MNTTSTNDNDHDDNNNNNNVVAVEAVVEASDNNIGDCRNKDDDQHPTITGTTSMIQQQCDALLHELQQQNPNNPTSTNNDHDFDVEVIHSFRSIMTLRDCQQDHYQELKFQKTYLQDTLQEILQVRTLLQQELGTCEHLQYEKNDSSSRDDNNDDDRSGNQERPYNDGTRAAVHEENRQLYQDLKYAIQQIRKQQPQQQAQQMVVRSKRKGRSNKNSDGDGDDDDDDPLFQLITALIRRAIDENDEHDDTGKDSSKQQPFLFAKDYSSSDVALLRRLYIIETYKNDKDFIRLIGP